MAEKLSINLNTDIKFLKGVGPQRASILNQNNIKTINDLIRYYPRKYLDRTNIKKIREVKIGEKAVIIAKVKSFSMKRTKKNRYFQVTIADDSGGYINCMWFNSLSWITDKFKIGDNVALFGKIEFYQSLRIIHPEFDILDESDDPINTGCIVPLYSSNNLLKKVGLDSRGIRKIILTIFSSLNNVLYDFYNEYFIKENGLQSHHLALNEIHNPSTNKSLATAIYRLKFDEHFFMQLLMALKKQHANNRIGIEYKNKGQYVGKVYNNLNFSLTNAQIKVLRERDTPGAIIPPRYFCLTTTSNVVAVPKSTTIKLSLLFET